MLKILHQSRQLLNRLKNKKMKNLIFLAGMLCLITLFSCEKNDLNPITSNIETSMEQVEWDQLSESILKGIEIEDVTNSRSETHPQTIDDQDTGLRACGSHIHTNQGTAGGNGGQTFNIHPNGKCDKIFAVAVKHGNFIEGIIFIYEKPDGKLYAKRAGSTGSVWSVMFFGQNEFIRQVETLSANFINHLRIATNQRSELFGTDASNLKLTDFDTQGPNREIKGFYGKSGALIDKIGVRVYSR